MMNNLLNEINWLYKPFASLSVTELYAILKLRSEVFVVEQNCVYLDMDGKDDRSFHLCGWHDNLPVAYARILPPGVAYDNEASIGRVSTAFAVRKYGAGRLLMEKAIHHCLDAFPDAGIKIGAQLYLHRFYTSLGFIQSGPEYMEDGIPHIEMKYAK